MVDHVVGDALIGRVIHSVHHSCIESRTHMSSVHTTGRSRHTCVVNRDPPGGVLMSKTAPFAGSARCAKPSATDGRSNQVIRSGRTAGATSSQTCSAAMPGRSTAQEYQQRRTTGLRLRPNTESPLSRARA